jgi:hypothetical protein
MSLDKYTKQPADTEDFDISFVDYLIARDDTGSGLTVAVDDGITLVSSNLVAGVAKVWLSGGTTGTTYKITATLTTTGGRIKQHEILVKVKEV